MLAVAGAFAEGATTVGAEMNVTHINPPVSAPRLSLRPSSRRSTSGKSPSPSGPRCRGLIGEGTHVAFRRRPRAFSPRSGRYRPARCWEQIASMPEQVADSTSGDILRRYHRIRFFQVHRHHACRRADDKQAAAHSGAVRKQRARTGRRLRPLHECRVGARAGRRGVRHRVHAMQALPAVRCRRRRQDWPISPAMA